MKVAKNLDKQINYSSKELISIEKINNQITNLYEEIKNLNMKLNQKEDDIKNIINEKDNIIREMEKKLLKQEKMITKNNIEISNLNKKIQEMNSKFYSELQDKENKINNINNKIFQFENNYLINELMNEEKSFELEIPSEGNLDKDEDNIKKNNYFSESTVYCMLKLNLITFTEINQSIILYLVAIGFSDN